MAQAGTSGRQDQAASASMPPVMLPGTILIVFPNGSGYLGDFPSSSGDGVIEAPGGADIDFFGPPGRVFHNHANRDHTHRPAHGAWRPARPCGIVDVQRIRINRFPTGLVPA